MDAVCALLFVTAAVVVITYSRLPAEELYSVSEEGLASGLGRALVFLNYPGALISVGVAWLAAEQLGSWNARLAALVASALCALAALPGVVDEHDLDAKPVNVLPVLGVGIALALSLRAPWRAVPRLPLDPARLVLAVVMAVAAIPWVFALLGFYAPGDVFLGEEIRPGGDGKLGRAVHLGDHEGLDGTLLVVAALVLSRHLVDVARPRARALIAYTLSVMLAYGFGVALNDFWLEQVEKRDWASWGPPNVLRPGLTWGWLGVVVAAAGVAALMLRLEAPRRRA